MEKIQAFFHKRKRATAFFLAGAITAVSFLPRIVNAYNLDDGWYSTLETTCTWGDDSEAMQVNRDKYGGQYTLTGLACYYPGEYQVTPNAALSTQDPWAGMGIVSQLITWICTDRGNRGFQGVPEGADAATVNAAFEQDLAYYRSSRYYTTNLPHTITPERDPVTYNELFSAPPAESEANSNV